jgi:hypothetical protein
MQIDVIESREDGESVIICEFVVRGGEGAEMRKPWEAGKGLETTSIERQ